MGCRCSKGKIVKKIGLIILSVITLALTGCGSHDYEGEWKMDVSSMGGLLGMASDMVAEEDIPTITLGDDYAILDGERMEISYEVVEKNGKTYLEMTDDGGEVEKVTVVDEDTLRFESTGVEFKRI